MLSMQTPGAPKKIEGQESNSHHSQIQTTSRIEAIYHSPEVTNFLYAIQESEVLSPLLKGQISRLHSLNMLDTSIIQSYFSRNSVRYELNHFLDDFIENIQQGEDGEFNEYKPRLLLTTDEKVALKNLIIGLENKELYRYLSSSDEIRHYDI